MTTTTPTTATPVPIATAITGIEIQWLLKFANRPYVTLTLDGRPDHEIRWFESTIHEEYIYRPIVKGGYIHQYIVNSGADSPNEPRFLGYGGHRFEHRMVDGTVRSSNDCWSGNPTGLPFSAVDVAIKNQVDRVAFSGYVVHTESARLLLRAMRRHNACRMPLHIRQGNYGNYFSVDSEQAAKPPIELTDNGFWYFDFSDAPIPLTVLGLEVYNNGSDPGHSIV